MQVVDETPVVPAVVERFVKQLVITYKAVTLYPPASNIPRENALEAVELLETILADVPEMRLVVNKDGVAYADVPVFPGRPAYAVFAQELYSRGVADVRFHAGVGPDGLTTFLGMLRHSPDELARSGGFATGLWDAGVDTVTVTDAATRIIDTDEAEQPEEIGEEWPPSRERMEELLASRTPAPRDRRVLIRALHDSDLMRRHLLDAFHEDESAEGLSRHATIVALARAADAQPGELRSSALQALADAILTMPADVCKKLLTEDMLREVRVDEGIACVVRQMGIDDVCQALVAETDASEVSTEALARALRNLSFISLAGREEVLNASGAAMRTAGMSEETVSSVLGMVAPSQLLVTEHETDDGEARPVESILRLMDLAPSAVAEPEDDPALAPLQEEARAGIGDGDVVSALVELAALDVGTPDFEASIGALEGGLSLLVERGEYGAAADAAESLMGVIERASAAEQERLHEAVRSMAGADAMRTVHRALQMYGKDTPEHDACKRLLSKLGMYAIDPLLEVLADEPDMSARKSLVDLISPIASTQIDELGKRVTDPRWYFVRNVVSILGATRKPEIVPHLGRTLRHADARVRRETIRALAHVPDVMAPQMIVGALEDSDAQNVQLAARYLGSLKVRSAIPALIKVVSGEGRGSREHAPRAEAIEALGIIGADEALGVLESIAEKRRLLGSGRTKGLRSVAESAIAAIKSSRGKGDSR